MTKTGIDHDALVNMFAEASTRQGEALRKAVSDATLKALQGRELTIANIRKVLKNVTEAASAGAARSGLPLPDMEAVLGKVFAGMDAALLKAVQANRVALEQLVSRGVDVQKGQMASALANLEKMEDTFFAAVGKAVKGMDQPLQGPWSQVLEAMKLQGTDSGAQASQTVEQMLAQAQTALRDSRAVGLRAAQTMLESYATLVSGVLIGMSEGLQQGTPAKPAAKSTARRK